MASVRTARWLLLGLTAIALLVGQVPGVAQAHTELSSSDPVDGAVLPVPPEELTFTFNEDLLPEGSAITATDVVTSVTLALPAATVDGDTVSVMWPADLPAGMMRASYRVVSADGHPVEGSITFTIASSAVAGAPSPLSSGDASASPAASATPQASTATSPAASTSPEASDSGGPGLIAWIVGLGIAVGLGALGGLAVTRRPRRR